MELLNLNKRKKQSRQLMDLFDKLDSTSRQSLLDYTEWLVSRSRNEAEEPEEVLTLLDIPRPEEESVIKGIKRLAATYPMVDRSSLFNETSSLMTQHVMQGKEAVIVIDELEVLFAQEYKKFCAETGESK